MTRPDPLDMLRNLLAGHSDPAVLDAAIAKVRAQIGGEKAYICSPVHDRIMALRADLARGTALAEIEARYCCSRQMLYYHRRKLNENK